jgi:hypothetical protein
MASSNVSRGEVNEALVWALQNGSPAGAPVLSRHNMIDHYGQEQADALLEEIRPLLQEIMAIPVDWTAQSWQEAGDHVRDTMLERHPYLSEEAAARLRGYFMFQTK